MSAGEKESGMLVSMCVSVEYANSRGAGYEKTERSQMCWRLAVQNPRKREKACGETV